MNFENQSILITGGTGSFGKKFVEIVLAEYSPKRLVVFSRDELKQHEMRQRFPDSGSSPVRYFVGDVRDRDRLMRAFHGVDVVVHAAALKQVPACEYNPFEAVQTNIMGAKNVIDAAIDSGVSRVLALSTDKAVNPVNLYGATKLVAEKLFIQGNAYAGGRGARFACVRYGNVIGSRGSVVPLFVEQRKSGRLTLTHPEMTRFWITLEQGVRFVIRGIELMRGGEIFVPKLPASSIRQLAEIIGPDCRVEVTGIRPGEKLHEVLIADGEARNAVELDHAYVVLPQFSWWDGDGAHQGRKLPADFFYSSDRARRLTEEEIRQLISGFHPAVRAAAVSQ